MLFINYFKTKNPAQSKTLWAGFFYSWQSAISNRRFPRDSRA